MKKNYFVGIDVSKQTIDVAFIIRDNQQQTQPCWKIFDNNEQGVHQWKHGCRAMKFPLQSRLYL
jgi:hypothetical protein